MRAEDLLAKKAGLPAAGRVRGVVTLVQEGRFRLEDEAGRGYLFTLGWESGVTIEDLSMWSQQRDTVIVDYQGPPDLGAVATRVERG